MVVRKTEYELPLTGSLPSVLLRGGATAALTTRKKQCKIERLSPA